MACRICIQLQEAAAGAQKPDTPNLLLGLNEAGLRNRARQKEERQLKTKLDLQNAVFSKFDISLDHHNFGS
jgi:hypothetical protein